MSPAERLLLDARRRMAHCLRHLHEHARARELLTDLLRQDPDRDIRAMVHADLGLMAGGFDGLEEVVLPPRRNELGGVLDRLAEGVEQFRESVAMEAPHSAHGHHCLDALATCDAALDHCPALADRLRERARGTGRAAVERAADLRSALRGFRERGDRKALGETLDDLEMLAHDDVAVPDFLELLEDRASYDLAWDLEDATHDQQLRRARFRRSGSAGRTGCRGTGQGSGGRRSGTAGEGRSRGVPQRSCWGGGPGAIVRAVANAAAAVR